MTPAPEQEARIFLIDDHPSVLEGLAAILSQNGHRICSTATTLDEAKQHLSECQPDIAIVDLSLCGESGLELLASLDEQGIPALVYSMHEDTATLKRAMDHGASGYVSKRESSDILLEAIHQVLAGKQYISPRAALNYDANFPPINAKALSDREQQIMILLAQGETNAEIAEAMHITGRTVESYCARIIAKLDLSGMKELRKYAISENKLVI